LRRFHLHYFAKTASISYEEFAEDVYVCAYDLSTSVGNAGARRSSHRGESEGRARGFSIRKNRDERILHSRRQLPVQQQHAFRGQKSLQNLVVDTDITNPTEESFFLASHEGIQVKTSSR
jgi:hypothetical protein